MQQGPAPDLPFGLLTVLLTLVCFRLDRKAVLAVENQTFQFFIDGDILINDEKIAGVPSAVLKNGRSMVPLFVISNQLGLPVSWEDSTRTANLILEL